MAALKSPDEILSSGGVENVKLHTEAASTPEICVLNSQLPVIHEV